MTPITFTVAVPEDSFVRPALDGVDRDITVEIEPGTITTMKESQLERRVGLHDDADESAVWVEYRLDGKVVHRSVHLALKKMPQPMQADAGSFV